jgi:predicted nuclease of predicted toxin-antitoxin system
MRKMLLDENLPRPLARYFSNDFEVFTVPDMGWASKKNGELIQAMLDEGFEILLTVDKGLPHQQNLNQYPIQIALILTYDNRLKTLMPHIHTIESTIGDRKDKLIEIDLRKN